MKTTDDDQCGIGNKEIYKMGWGGNLLYIKYPNEKFTGQFSKSVDTT